jgi:hypothetical protein
MATPKKNSDGDINKIMANLVKKTDEFNAANIKKHPEWKDHMMDVSKEARARAKSGGYSGSNIKGKR